MGGLLKIALLMGVIWAIMAIADGTGHIRMGIYYYMFSSSSMSPISSFGGYLLIAGVIMLIGGLLVVVSCLNLFRLERYRETLICYLIGFVMAIISGIVAILGYGHTIASIGGTSIFESIVAETIVLYGYGIVVGIIGMLFSLLIKKEKHRFRS
jgi:hypothetical protein